MTETEKQMKLKRGLPDHLELRLADSSDADDLAQFVNSVYRGESGRKSWTSEAHFIQGQRTDPNLIREILNDPNQVILQLLDLNSSQTCDVRQSQSRQGAASGRVGCVHLTREKDFAWLGMLTVDVRQQRAGFGSILVQQAEQAIVELWGLHVVKMKVISIRKELLNWYYTRGYQLTNDRMIFPMDNPRMGNPLRSDLEFLILQKEV